MASQKVYVIDDPQRTARRRSLAPEPTPRTGPSTASRSGESRYTDRRWLIALRAFALGPLNLFLWPSGRGRAGWAAIGAISLVASACLVTWWEPYFEASAHSGRSVVLWTLSAALVLLLVCFAWSRSVAMSPGNARWPGAFRRPLVAFVLGLLLPGFGLLIAGRRWRAAIALWLVGVSTVAGIIATKWLGLPGVLAGAGGPLTPVAFEGILIGLLALAFVGAVVWLVQALDAGRLLSSNPRTGTVAGAFVFALLAAIVVSAAVYPPADLSRDLGLVAGDLEARGLKVMPLALYEAAAHIHPSTPGHMLNAAALFEELGHPRAADARRAVLQERAARYAKALDATLVPVPSVPAWARGDAPPPLSFLGMTIPL